MLSVTAQDAVRHKCADNPAFAVNYAGFKNGDRACALDMPVTVGALSDYKSSVGTYALVPGGGLDSNYDFIYVGGVRALLLILDHGPFNHHF